MARPRESILNMFDPLNLQGPATPKRDELSRSPESDKENSEPNMGEMTAFFSRTYSRKTEQVPAKSMKRLIDVGDVTAIMEEDGAELSMLAEEEEEGEEDAENERVLGQLGMDGTPRHETKSFPMSPDDAETPMQRVPFQDITPEATPVGRNRTLHYDEGGPSLTDSAIHLSPRTTRAPLGSPLASVINSINFGDETSTSTEPELPQISISSPSRSTQIFDPASSTADMIPSTSSALLTRTTHIDLLACSTAHLVPSATSALLTKVPLSESVCRPLSPPGFTSPPNLSQTSSSPLRPRSQTTPSSSKHTSAPSPQTVKAPHIASPNFSHTRPASIDLHSSFNVQLSNAESSFDLLNDRISFFDSGMGMSMGMESSRADMTLNLDESVLMGDFDLKGEEARMRAFLGTQKLSPVRGEGTGPVSINSTPRARSTGNDEAGASSSTESTPKMVKEAPSARKRHSSPLSSIPSFSKDPKDVSPTRSPPKSQAINLPVKPYAPRRSIPTSSATLTPKSQTPVKPAFVAPPPVPALRIVKRAVTTTNAFAKPSSALSRPSLSARPPLPPIPAEKLAPVHKPALKGVQRPRPSKAALVAPRGIVGLGSRMAKPTATVDGTERSIPALSRPISVAAQADSTASAKTRTTGGVQAAAGDLPAAAPKTLRQPSSRFGYGGAGKPAEQTSLIAGVGVASIRQPGSSRLPAPGSRTIGKVGSSIPGAGKMVGTGVGRRV